MTDIQKLAQLVDEAALKAQAIEQISASENLPLDTAYQVQRASIARRLERGEAIVGAKLGFTSRAKAIQMGIADMIWGRLTSGMMLEDAGEIDIKKYVHPRIEPEIAFRLKKPLAGRLTMAECLAAIESVAPAMEVIDSRYKNFKFSLSDVVADNSSSSGFVVGAWSKPDVDLSNLGMILEFDGKPVQIGSSAAILGQPLRALQAAARLVAEEGETLQPGHILLAGAATAAEALRPGITVRNSVEGLGFVSLRVKA